MYSPDRRTGLKLGSWGSRSVQSAPIYRGPDIPGKTLSPDHDHPSKSGSGCNRICFVQILFILKKVRSSRKQDEARQVRMSCVI